MQQNAIDELWGDYERARRNLTESERTLRMVRDALVSHYCQCYQDGKEWEQCAVWCVSRANGTCPYYSELKGRI
jgi:hypothetical protein